MGRKLIRPLFTSMMPLSRRSRASPEAERSVVVLMNRRTDHQVQTFAVAYHDQDVDGALDIYRSFPCRDIDNLLPRGHPFGSGWIIKRDKQVIGSIQHSMFIEPVLFFLAKTLHLGKQNLFLPSELKVWPLPQGDLPVVVQEHQSRNTLAEQVRQCVRIAGVVSQPRFILIQSAGSRVSQPGDVFTNIHHRRQDNIHVRRGPGEHQLPSSTSTGSGRTTLLAASTI